jgi:hypothetical protein
VIVWLWRAGSAEGVTDDEVKARTAAASFMRSNRVNTAVVEMAYFDDGVKSLSSGYVSADAWRWVARLHPGSRVSWSSVAAKSEVAA